ncbi:PREDICTED: immunoglobulin superfamily member 10 [Chaetura pelagica]|uniref:immunoglobulin superfamily member 10 n=1 Tax=Chaetura pelagica TaxID=8897 RepID=UPI00052392CD|nr:PREDICTED: immunoglobulin superfamily member 10 [Chaetura pelagica]
MLHSNEINTIPEKVFRDLSSLQVLKMSYNKVRVLQQYAFYGLRSLVRLHMDHNKIEFVNPKVFYGLTSLRLVHLEGNLLKQLHPDTFVSLRYSQIFKISFIKHIYLSDNVLTSLPQEMFSSMSELESIYLHGNPWCCDCNLQWFAEWARQRPDVIKCKKDRSSGAQQCPMCASPKNHKEKSLVDVPSASLACMKPAIHGSLKLKNLTVPDDGDFSAISPKDFVAPIGSMVLNMTDQAGNRGNLVCNIQSPKEMSPISFDKDGNSTVLKTSFSSFLVCGIDYEHIQQLWSILALYSNSPLRLERNILATNTPFLSYKYKQIYSEKDDLFTNIEVELRAEPPWLMQRQVALQLDRTKTTLNTLHIQYFTDAQIILPRADENQEGNSWAIISRDNRTQTEHTVLVGGTVQLECQASGEPAPAIEWLLADGSKVRAPYVSEDGRIIVVNTGTLMLRAADTFDTGLYHCIGTTEQDADALTFRVTVLDARVEPGGANGARLSAPAGSTLDLPCTSSAVPDAAVSWVLPEPVVLHHSARNKQIFDNGTLRIQGVTERDSGYFRCVAANQYGVDLLVFQVLVRQDETTPKKKHVVVGEEEEDGGSGEVVLVSAAAQKHPLAPLAPQTPGQDSAASAARNRVPQSVPTRNSYGRMAHRHSGDKRGRRFRGHRRQFVSSARRADPQRWAALLEKTKRNSTLTENQGEVATKPPIQAHELSKLSEDEEEASGDLLSPEEEFMIPVTETAPVPALGRAVVPVGPATIVRDPPARTTSAPAAGTPLPPPLSGSGASDSRRPQAYLKPTSTNSEERSDLSQISAKGINQSSLSHGGSGTATLSPAGQRPVYSGESNNQYLKSVSTTPMTGVTVTSNSVTSHNAVDKLHVFTESIEISTKIDHQTPVVTGREPSPEFGHIYFHSTQKQVTPKPPLDSTINTHQQTQIIQDTHTPQAQQHHGRQRKISGRRQIVRPGQISKMKEHRYNFGRSGSVRESTGLAADVQLNTKHLSTLPTLKNFSSSMNPTSPEAPLSSPPTMNVPLEPPAGTHVSTAFLREEKNNPSARQKATTTAMPLITKGTQDTPQWNLETSAPFQTREEVPLQPLSEQTDGFPSVQASTLLPKTPTSAVPRMSPLHFPPISTATKITRRKTFRGGRKRGQRRKKPPVTSAWPRLLTAHAGKALAVPCRAEGRPPPAISWVLANQTRVSRSSAGNRKVRVEADGTLVLEEVTVYDRGLYTCTATNPAGSDTRAVKLQVVAAPPAILEEKRERVEGAAGGSLRLPCTVKGNPQPAVHWVLFDGTVVKPLQVANAKLFLFSNGTLQLSNMVPSDSGNYECIATSSTGSERRVVSLVVEHRDTLPRIATASQEMTQLNFGDKLLLNCTATGEPKPRIIWRLPSKAVVDQWHRMGSRIHVYPNGSLVIEAVTEKDAGDYLCVARNIIGDDLILMKVSITMKPARIDQKQYFKKLVPYGKDFTVDCKASGSPTPEISWSLPDGTVINNAMLADDSGRRTRRYVLFDNGTLYLNKAGVTEGGDYTCYAQNTLGRDEMKVHITVVMAAPQIKHSYKTYVHVKAGDTALLDCEAAGEPKPKIFWLLPSSDMISSSTARHLLHVNGSLSVRQVKLLDAGDYMCVARNPGGDDTKLYKLNVAAKPPIINGLHANKTIMKVTAVRHSKKHLDCRAEGTPSPQIMWIMPDNIFLTAPYYGSRIVVHQNGTLEIRNLRPSDTADFICVARNEGGESTLVVQLEVLEMLRRPMFKNPFNERIIAKPGKTITLNCSVDGNPPPDISWMLPNGTWFSRGIKTPQFLTGGSGTLTIYSPDRDSAGKYRCAARNSVGYIEKLIILEVAQKPNILTHPAGPVKGISGEPLSLHCLSDGSPRPHTAWTLPGGRVLHQPQLSGRYLLLENGTLVIREATVHDRGHYVCKAHNDAGDSSVTVPVVIVAYPPRITSRPPRSLHTMPGAAVQLHCAALGIPKPEITWELPDHSILSTSQQGRALGSELLHPHGTLLLQNPRPAHSGAYKCTARNPLGSDFTVTYLHVI